MFLVGPNREKIEKLPHCPMKEKMVGRWWVVTGREHDGGIRSADDVVS